MLSHKNESVRVFVCRGAWRWLGSQERQAGGYGGGAVAVGGGAACRQDHERVKGKPLPVVVAVGSIAR